MSESRDFVAILRLRANAIKGTAKQSCDQPLREVMYKTAFVLIEAAVEIEALRIKVQQLEKINLQLQSD